MIDNNSMGMYQGYTVEGELKINANDKKISMPATCGCPPIYECPIEKCVHREIIHEVPQVCPFM